MYRDYGSGLTVDDLIGMPAWQIDRMVLPQSQVFKPVRRSARVMVRAGLESYLLTELWEDGHTVWHSHSQNIPVVVVTPGGRMICTQS